LLAFIRAAAEKARRVASVCSGAFLLAEAGLLAGRRATTHWDAVNDFMTRYPDTDLDADAIYLRDGKFWSSAGVTAGIDLTLALIEADFGQEVALSAARHLVVYMMRPGGQAQFSVRLQAGKPKDQRLRDLPVWIEENLAQDLSVSCLASKAAMSRRNFTRRFTEQTGMSLALFVERCRLENARRQLETSDASLESVAAESGLASVEVLRRLFQRYLGTSPMQYPGRFRTALRHSQREEKT
jgi:transcriptional regulator GlxA family with amidase domain